jgi:mannosyltransferase
MLKPKFNRSFLHRIKSKINLFSKINLKVNLKFSPIKSIKLYKLLLLILLLSLSLHSIIYKNQRIKPLSNIDYSNLSNSKLIKSYDDKFQGEILKKCPISERSFKSIIDDVFQYGCRDPLIESEKPRANAAFVVLARNSEIDGVILSMRSLERRFNQWFNYPWIFLNDEPFTKEFETRVEEVASGDFKFGVIPKSKWNFNQQNLNNNNNNNNNNNKIFFEESIENQGDRGIMYGNMQSYHSMCRFYSGFFFEHPLVKSLDWYWRVEPEVDFYCDLTYDPFIEMEKNGKKYGYTIAIKELIDTVPNLFRYTLKFINENNIKLPDTWNFFTNNYKFFNGDNELNYFDVKNLNDFWRKLKYNTILNYSKLSLINNDNNNNNNKISIKNKNDLIYLKNLIKNSKSQNLINNNLIHEKYNNQNFNLCHFWSNFEIASNDLFTSPEYKAYYEFLENSNGFFTERWGDAPIHSLAAGMFLNLSEIHYFRDIGYKHSTLGHCPYNSPNQLPYKASPLFKHQILPKDEIYYADYDKPISSFNNENLGASGCRCRCPSDHKEIENSAGSCSALWLKLTSDEYQDAKNGNNLNFIGGLGDFNYLDLNKIESQTLNWLNDWIKNGKNLKDWDITDDQKNLLSSMYI